MSQAGTSIRCRAFSVPKNGNSRAEYEDACAFELKAGRFAVADGASESVFAGEWANLLCQSFVADSLDPGKIVEWRQAMQKRWLALVFQQDLPWYLEEKVKEGAYATFLGLTLVGENWQALAIGDSCLFHVRGAKLLTAFPLDRAEEFGTRPGLIGSRQKSDPVTRQATGTLQPGDSLLLMTDALAEWFLRTGDEGGTPWSKLLRLSEGDFTAWIDALRETVAIKNDDVTMLVVDMK